MLKKSLLTVAILSLLPTISFASAALQAQQRKQQAAQAQMMQMQQAAIMQRQQQLQMQYQQAMQQVQQQALAQQAAIASGARLQSPSTLTSSLSTPTSTQSITTQSGDVKTLEDVWRLLETSSTAWSLIVDQEPKIIIVERQIAVFRQQGVMISKPAQHYVQMIDAIAIENSGLLVKPFRDVLRFAAVVEYDFHNGVDSDTQARQLLGDEAYLANRQRLGL